MRAAVYYSNKDIRIEERPIPKENRVSDHLGKEFPRNDRQYAKIIKTGGDLDASN